MASPFPGMDPYIESHGVLLWEDFHHRLISKITDDLESRVPSSYVVRTGERNFIVVVDPEENTKTRVFKPDVGISTSGSGAAASPQSATAVLEAPETDTEVTTVRAVVAESFRETFVEIYALEPERRLVTCIEVLSPTNKRKGTAGWDEYLRKRQALLLGEANLVEIDLLRAGARMPTVDPLPNSPYYLLVARKSRAPYCRVSKAHYRKPLPIIPVPLEDPDADIPIDLQSMVGTIYERSRYQNDIDYSKPAKPPLPEEDQAWLQQQLAAKP